MVEIINKFIWDQWCNTSKPDLKKALEHLPKKQIIQIAETRIENLSGTKPQIIKIILDFIFL